MCSLIIPTGFAPAPLLDSFSWPPAQQKALFDFFDVHIIADQC
jgi:hypothetical protein